MRNLFKGFPIKILKIPFFIKFFIKKEVKIIKI